MHALSYTTRRDRRDGDGAHVGGGLASVRSTADGFDPCYAERDRELRVHRIRLVPTSYLERKREKTLAKFHAVTVIWAIISWCPGYGSEENPVFWKQVFDRRDLSDAIRFFRYEAFPRVLLHFETTNYLKLVPDTIFAYCNSNVGFFIRRHVEPTLRTLAPFISPGRVTQVINVTVAVCCVRSSDYNFVFRQLRAIRDTKRSSRPPVAGVQVKVDNLTPGFLEVKDRLDLLMLNRLLDDAHNNVSQLSCRIETGLPNPTSDLLWKITCSSSSIQQLTLSCERMADPVIGSLFSFLPYTSSLQRLRVKFLSQYRASDSQKHLWYWMEYALRHPNSANSLLRHLVLEGAHDEDNLLEQVQSLRHRQRSEVLLQACSVIRSRHGRSSAVTCVLDTNTWFDLCFWRRQPEWTCVIMPGLGIGWVENTAVLAERPRHATNAYLRSLICWMDGGPEMVCHLVQGYGSKLHVLDVRTERLATAAEVISVLGASPELTSLHMSHDGSIWSENIDLTGAYRSLQELSFDGLVADKIIPLKSVMDGSFVNVTALRLERRHTCNMEIMKQMGTLLRYNIRLQYLFYLSEGRLNRTGNTTTGYVQQRSTFRRILSLGDGVNVMAQTTLLGPCRLAFLSVIRRLEDNGEICSGFDQGILQNVFSYASTDLPREVWVDRVPPLASAA